MTRDADPGSRPAFAAPRPLSPQEIAALPGLDYMRMIAEGKAPQAPMALSLGFAIEQASEGRIVFRGRPGRAFYNPIGSLHGGWVGAILDSCMGCAAHATLPAGRGYATLEYKVNIIRPLFDDSGEVLAIGEVSHSGRRSAVADGRLVGADDGRLYATGSTTCMIFDL